MPASASRWVNRIAVSWAPLSAWWMSRRWAGSPSRPRPQMASSSAPAPARYGPGRGLPADDPPRERIAHRSSYSGPSPVPIRDLSATHSRFGAGAVKSRLTRSGAGIAVGSWRVEQRQRLRRNAPCRPAVPSAAPPACGRCGCRRGAAGRDPGHPLGPTRALVDRADLARHPGVLAPALAGAALLGPASRRTSRPGSVAPGGWARPRTGHDAHRRSS
jgi:hypothetical protein